MTATPAHVPPGRVRVWNYVSDPDYAAGPHTAFDKFRGEPAFWTPCNGGHWVLTDPTDIRDALQSPDRFSNDTTAIPGNGLPTGLIPVELDPPEHAVYRSTLAPMFSPREAQRLDRLIAAVCTDLLDELVGRGRCEFVGDFAKVLPARLFFRWMDLPMKQADRMASLVHGLTARDTPLSPRAASVEIHRFLRAEVERRADRAGGDLISALFDAEVAGRAPTVDEVYDITYLLFLAGLDTTTGVLSFLFRHLATHPAHRAWLMAEPDRLTRGVEELIRRYPISNNVRRVRHDQVFAGVELHTDDLVLLPMVLANGQRDVEAPLATAVRVNFAFGGGIHRCLGSHLARREMITAVDLWHRRIPDYRIDGYLGEVGFGGPVMGLHRLPLAWT